MVLPIDARTEELESTLVAKRFDKALEALQAEKYEVARVRQNASLRIAQGRDAKVPQYGNYVAEGGIYLKNEPGIIVAQSPFLTNKERVQEAITANRAGKYFGTEDEKLYEQFRKQVEADRSKDPLDRQAMLMPSDKSFNLSPTENPEHFTMLFGTSGQPYLTFVNQDTVTFYPISQDTLKQYPGTVTTQLWFGCVDDRSGLYGGYCDLDDVYWVRGVRPVRREAPNFEASSEARTRSGSDAAMVQKISSEEENSELLYTPEQIKEYLTVAQAVRTGERPNKDLESIIDFFKKFK